MSHHFWTRAQRPGASSTGTVRTALQERRDPGEDVDGQLATVRGHDIPKISELLGH